MIKHQQAAQQKAWSVSLNGYDLEEAKILHLGGKPLNAPEGQSAFIMRGDLFIYFLKSRILKRGLSACRLPEQPEGSVQSSSHARLDEKDPVHIFSSGQDPRRSRAQE